MPRNYESGKLCTVPLNSISQGMRYMWRSRIRASLRNDLGVTELDVAGLVDVNKIIFEANNIKPPRATKFIDLVVGIESSFVDPARVIQLRQDGWTTKRAKLRALKPTTKLTELYYVKVNQIKYGFSVPRHGDIPSDLTAATGMIRATSADTDIVIGCSFPVPPKAIYTMANNKKFETFCDPDVYDNLTGDWEQGDVGTYTITTFKALFEGQ